MNTPFQLHIDDHLELRQRAREDANELFALTDANRAYLRGSLAWLDFCLTPSDTLKNIESSLQQAQEGTGLAVTIREHGRIVGVTGFNTIEKANRIGHIGYWLGRQFEGRGIMTRAVKALVAAGFEQMGLNRIVIAAATDNQRSRAIAERLGFYFEGIAREAEWLYGRVVDHAVYALTRSTWDKGASDVAPLTTPIIQHLDTAP